ncbi:MAG: OB-fold domain-containing protein [Nitrospirae bacterium]|nr:OB-fold domain-containing protein [Nitrospirota bacterium]
MDNPRDIIANLGKLGLDHYGDEATHTFFDHLRAREFKSTRCKKCAALHYPPRNFCPACGHRETEWVDLPRKAKLYAFSQQDRALRFMKPDVLGLVEIEGLGHILSKVDAPIESLSIGQDLELDFIEIEGGIVLHQFKPTRTA